MNDDVMKPTDPPGPPQTTRPLRPASGPPPATHRGPLPGLISPEPHLDSLKTSGAEVGV